MSPHLPPPDPLEPSGSWPDAPLPVPPPATVFLSGPPNRAQDRLCAAILDYRPGLLVICVKT